MNVRKFDIWLEKFLAARPGATRRKLSLSMGKYDTYLHQKRPKYARVKQVSDQDIELLKEIMLYEYEYEEVVNHE